MAAMTPDPCCGVPIDVFEAVSSELVMIQILEELDPIINDLLRFCEQPKRDDVDPAVQLNSALRIGKHHAPNDSFNVETRWAIEQKWIDAYLAMQDGGDHKSVDKIAQEIAKSMSITKETARNHWNAKKKREPWQANWAKQIEDGAKLRVTREKQLAKDAKVTKKAGASKPKKSVYRKNNL